MFQKIAVVGAGAVGLLYGSRLQQLALSVVYQSRTLAQHGSKQTLVVESIWGHATLEIEVAVDTLAMQPADLIIISTKALPEIQYQSLLKPLVKENSVLWVLQNGLGVEEHLHQLFPHNPIVGGLAFVCVHRGNKTSIHHLDYGRLVVAPLNAQAEAAAKTLQLLFKEAGVPVEFTPNLRKARWQKLLWNVPFNPLSVLLRASTQSMMDAPGIESLCRDLMHEVVALAKAEGHALEETAVEDMIQKTKQMKPYKTSMLLDFEAGRPLETEAILGNPLKIAHKLSVAVPKINMLYQMLCFMAQHRDSL